MHKKIKEIKEQIQLAKNLSIFDKSMKNKLVTIDYFLGKEQDGSRDGFYISIYDPKTKQTTHMTGFSKPLISLDDTKMFGIDLKKLCEEAEIGYCL